MYGDENWVRAQNKADKEVKFLQEDVRQSKLPGVHPEIKNTGRLFQEHLSIWQVIKQALGIKPVAWRVKHYADGWIYFDDLGEAQDQALETGGLVQTLYTL